MHTCTKFRSYVFYQKYALTNLDGKEKLSCPGAVWTRWGKCTREWCIKRAFLFVFRRSKKYLLPWFCVFLFLFLLFLGSRSARLPVIESFCARLIVFLPGVRDSENLILSFESLFILTEENESFIVIRSNLTHCFNLLIQFFSLLILKFTSLLNWMHNKKFKKNTECRTSALLENLFN